MATSNELLTTILKNVSRAFYLSMRVLPEGVRQPISLGYLLARAADTVADTPDQSTPERLRRLECLRAWVEQLTPESVQSAEEARTWSEGATEGEKRLMDVFPQALSLTARLDADDRRDVQSVVQTLISGMVLDLSHFPGRFTECAELDRYTYLVAGCVGEFWSRIIARHTPALKGWDCQHWSEVGIRFGKALQLTNVLRDAVKDLENGRSYIPGLVREEWLAEVSTSGCSYYEGAMKHLNSNQRDEILGQWLKFALDHYRNAIDYVMSMPWHCWRLRLAVVWPVAIGLATLTKLSASKTWLQQGCRVKVERRWVYRMLILTAGISWCDGALRAWLNSWWQSAYAGACKLSSSQR